MIVRNRATVRDIFRMFASMAHGATFGELCVRFNPAALNINEKQMVLFGLVEGLIRRVDRYPVTVSRNLFIDDDVMPHHIQTHLLTAHHHRAATRPLPRGERWNPRGGTNPKNTTSNTNKPPFFNHESPLSQQQQHQRSFQHHYWNKPHQSSTGNSAHSTSLPQHQQPQQQPQAFFYNGLKSLDEICCARGISCQQLEQQLARDRHVIVLLK